MKFLSQHSTIAACVLISACIALLAQPRALAESSADQYKEYQDMLRIAQRKVDRLKALGAGSAGALSTSLVMSVLGRYYQVGDHWDVLAWQISSTMAAMTSEPVKYRYHAGKFHYEVIEVKPGNPSQVAVRITQETGASLPAADPRVQWLDLTMTSQFSQDSKIYHFRNQNDYSASPNGVHSNVSILELFPLDVPDIYTAERSTPSALPDLPVEIKDQATAAGYSAQLSQSSWFDQEDLFGRPVQILWQHGDLWPAYMKTPTGIAILARR